MENLLDIPFPKFSISEYITKKANPYALNYFSQVPYRSKKAIERLETELYNYTKVSDRVQFIGVLINYIIKVTKEHTDNCSKEHCAVDENSQDVLYFLYRKLEDDDIKVDPETFTPDEL